MELFLFTLLVLVVINTAKENNNQQQVVESEQPVSIKNDVIVNAYDMDTYMKENNIKAYFCSHENRIYWVQNVEETMFCPNDSTLLYAC